MRLEEYTALDATALAGLVAGGDVSAAEVRDAALRAVEAVEPQLNAVVAGPYDDVEPVGAGPLAGVPFAVKDTLPEAGRPLQFGTALLEGYVPRRDATLTERFRAAGMVSVARSATPEFAANFDTAPRVHGPTRNPWDPDRSPGGSSGGAAALVASRALPVAHANDGAGSIRVPAAYCGLVGLKPSRGRVPVGPAVGEAVGGFAHEFALARSVRDAALLLDCLGGPSPGDRYYVAPPAEPFRAALDRPPQGLRIAIHTEAFAGVPTAPHVAAAVQAAGRALEDLGHHVEPACPRVDHDALRRCCSTIWDVELAGLAATFARATGREVGPETVEAASRGCIRRGQQTPALQLAAAQAIANSTARRWGRFLDLYDAFLCPVALDVAPPSGRPDQDDPRYEHEVAWLDDLAAHLPFTPIANLTGQPAISLPLAEHEGLPVGVMLTAQTLREDLLVALAAQLEVSLPWGDRRPRVVAP